MAAAKVAAGATRGPRRRPVSGGDSAAGLRARDRHRRIGFSFAASLFAKLCMLATTLALAPLAIGYLGNESFGLWMTIAAAGAFLGVGDLGIGLGVLNEVAEAHGRDDREQAGAAAAAAFHMLVLVAAGLGLLFLGVYAWVPWDRVLGVAGSPAASQAAPAVAAFAACFLLGLPFSLAQHLFSAYQEAYRGALWTAGGLLLGLALVYLGTRLGWPLWALVAASAGAPVAANIAAHRHAVARRPWLRPRWQRRSGGRSLALLRAGAPFLVIQASMLLAFQSDALILAWRIGPSAVTDYNVVSRLFMQVPAFLGLVLMPLWPAYREALARGDQAWVRRTLRTSFAVSALLGALLCGAGLLLGDWFIRLWMGGKVVPSPLLLASFAAWAWVNCLGGPLYMFMNGAGAIVFQAACYAPMALVNVLLSWHWTGRYGTAGVLMGSLVAQVLLGLLPALWYVFLRRPERPRSHA